MRKPVRGIVLVACLAAAACGRRPASLEAKPRQVTIYGVGRTAVVAAKVLDKRGQPMEDARVTWTCSNPAVVTCGDDGQVTAKKPGRAVATAKSGKLSTTVAVTVSPISEISLQPPVIHLVGPAGMTLRLAPSARAGDGSPLPAPAGLRWASKNPGVVAVSPDGTLTARSTGRANVSASLGDLFAESEVDVTIRAISRIELRPQTMLLKAGDSSRFVVLAYDDKGYPVPDVAAQFTCANPAVARVGADGTATAVAAGSTAVTVSLGSMTAQATVLVN